MGIFGLGHDHKKGKLFVKIVKAEGLKDMDKFTARKSDPYVLLNLKGDATTVKTKAIDNNLNPVWNAEYSFDISDSHERREIDFKVMDKDLGEDDFLGKGSADIEKVYKGEKLELKIRLKNKLGVPSDGYLFLEVHFQEAA